MPANQSRPDPFTHPIYHTRPLLPPLGALQDRLKDVWASQILTNSGAQLIEFEQRLSGVLGARFLSVHANATLALICAMKALDLTGEVITTPFTFAATPNSIVWAGLKPVFADIDPQTLTLHPEAVEKAITPATSAILAVHVLGAPCDVEGLKEVADRYSLKLIYDAAHAFGMKIRGCHISDFGDASVYSLHATKLFHSAEGGAVAMRDEASHVKLATMRNFGFEQTGDVSEIGFNSKMSELHAALGLAVLDVLEGERERRRKIGEIYRARIRKIPGLGTIELPSDLTSSYQYFPLMIDRHAFGVSRDQLVSELTSYNVFARRYFYPLCSSFKAYRSIPSAAATNLPVAERIVQTCMCLPFYGGLTDEDANRLCDIIEIIQRDFGSR